MLMLILDNALGWRANPAPECQSASRHAVVTWHDFTGPVARFGEIAKGLAAQLAGTPSTGLDARRYMGRWGVRHSLARSA